MLLALVGLIGVGSSPTGASAITKPRPISASKAPAARAKAQPSRYLASGRYQPNFVVGSRLAAVNAGTAVDAAVTHAAATAKSAADTQTTPAAAAATAWNETLPVSGMRIMNYYPAGAGWTKMWSAYSHDQTSSDFAYIRSLGANTVRIIVSPAELGWPTITPAGLAKFHDVLNTAASRNLHVQLTLFDWWGSYTGITGSKNWVSQLLAGQSGNKQISLVELQNEMDPTNATQMSWARTMMAYLPTVLPGVPRTISVAGSRGIPGAKQLLDAIPADLQEVVDLHIYGTWTTVISVMSAAKGIAGGRPIVIGETGQPTGPNPTTGSEESQAHYYANIGQLARHYGLNMPAPWILSDFNADGIPPGRAKIPGEAWMGLRRVDGSWKPAAYAVNAMFNAGVPTTQTTTLAASAPSAAQSAAGDTFTFGARPDGGFEREDLVATNKVFGSWCVINAASASQIGIGATVGRTGHGAFITGAGSDSNHVPGIYETFPLFGTSKVTATAWTSLVKATGGTRISIVWYGPNGYISQTESALANTKVVGWQQLSVTANAPAGATLVQVHVKSSSNSGTAYFDDVAVTGSAS